MVNNSDAKLIYQLWTEDNQLTKYKLSWVT